MPQFLMSEAGDVLIRALTDALDVVDFGIVLLDADLNVRFINQALTTIWHYPTAALPRHPTFRDLVAYAAASDCYAVPEAEIPGFLAEREAEVRAGDPLTRRIELNDGRSVLFRCTASPDGGRILTYTDITQALRDEADKVLERGTADSRFAAEIMESQAAYLATLAESAEENAQRAESSRRLLETEIAERRQLEARLRVLATTDGLTGALNRAESMASGERMLAEAVQSGDDLAVLMLDVDHFKRINDEHGHAGGDQALRHLVAVLRSCTRSADLVGRLGGEEFVILLPGSAPGAASAVAERVRTRVADGSLRFADRHIAMTVSLGVAGLLDTDTSIEQLIARADAALYRAKSNGRNRVEQSAQPLAA